MKHTPEPWRWRQHHYYCEVFGGGRLLGDLRPSGNYGDIGLEEANAKRIVDCVNACAGMEDPQEEIDKLKSNQFPDGGLQVSYDELLGALRKLEVATNTVSGCYTRNPANFALALKEMEHVADEVRALRTKCGVQT